MGILNLTIIIIIIIIQEEIHPSYLPFNIIYCWLMYPPPKKNKWIRKHQVFVWIKSQSIYTTFKALNKCATMMIPEHSVQIVLIHTYKNKKLSVGIQLCNILHRMQYKNIIRTRSWPKRARGLKKYISIKIGKK